MSNRVYASLLLGLAVVLLSSTSCSSKSDTLGYLDPYTEDPVTELGERNNQAILGASSAESGSMGREERARHALQAMGAYRRSQEPQPYYPVLQPAEVRLMWVPDHLNKFGDLIPAHYYFLRVLPERWAVQDSFDMEGQLHVDRVGKGADALGASGTPWVYDRHRGGNQR